ncbi:hypothetical protein F4802DRAFT_561212 [Xylaria palmicola]|nr:hypothetical protein F4802DRAFT_561212 [Xylaria palmicola]
MATSREERMQQRMRGAGRHEVADDSFGFVLPVAETSPDPSPSLPQIRSEPNTSAKRRRLNNEPGSATSQPSSASVATRSSTRLSNGQNPAQISAIQHVGVRNLASPQNSPPTTTKKISASLNSLNLDHNGTPQGEAGDDTRRVLQSAAEAPTGEPQSPEDVEMSVPRRISQGSRGSAASKLSNVSMMDLTEEVTESPVAAPGSGRRRRIERTDALTQSAKLQRVVMEEEESGVAGEVATSSPLARKTRQSTATAATLSARTTRSGVRNTPSSPLDAPQDSSPLLRHSRKSGNTVATGSPRSTRSQRHQSTPTAVAHHGQELSSPPDAAGTGSPKKRQLRRKPETILESPYEIGESEEENLEQRPGVEVEAEPEPEVELEPELEPEPEPEAEVEAGVEADDEEAEQVNDLEAARRIGRKRPRVSPRTSPRRKQAPGNADVAESPRASLGGPAKKRRPRQKKISPAKQSQPRAIKKRSKPSARRKSDGDSIPITVQRYTKPLRRNESGTDEDILNADIPFTDHKSPNVVDVLLQMCEEEMEKYLSALHEEAGQADGPANRKIYRTRLRAVEAFQEELRTRLQAQTIALDNLRTLKKRVKAAQKEKVLLRNEILRIRAEREQVALKIDAVRMRHETANKESLQQLGLSSTMDDIELAIENGKMAPELNARGQKAAGLANLDLLISQITSQVGVASGGGGGTLKQIKDFNLFLERVAAALEGR